MPLGGIMQSAATVEGHREILVREDGYVQGTRMCAAGGRTLDWYLKAVDEPGARDLAREIGVKAGLSRSGRIELWEPGRPVPLVQGYGRPGVEDAERPAWVHPRLAMRLADWCLPIGASEVIGRLPVGLQRSDKVVVTEDGTPLEVVLSANGHVNASRLLADTGASVESGLKKRAVRSYLDAVAAAEGRATGTDESGKRVEVWDGQGREPLLHLVGDLADVWASPHAVMAVAGMLEEDMRARVVGVVMRYARVG